MTDFTELRDDLHGAVKAMSDYAGAVQRRDAAVTVELSRLWDDIGELRDELHAVANRLENLTRTITTAPAEVAQSMHALTGKPLVLVGGPGDAVDCVSCRGSGTTPAGGKCPVCDGFGQVRHA